MNETNFPENQLRSWQPRRASARLKRRIFTSREVSAQSVWGQCLLVFKNTGGMPLSLLRWLTPAAACLMLALSAVKQSNDFREASRAQPALALIASNQIAYVPETYLRDRNEFRTITFDWTNRSGSTSSIGSFLPGKVN